MCWSGAPHLDLVEQALGVEEMVPEEPILHLVAPGWRWGCLSWGNPPSPSWKGDLLVIPIRIPAPWWFSPRCWLRIAGVHAACEVQFPGRDPPWVDAALGLWGCQALPGGNTESPTWVRVTSGWMWFTPLWRWRSQFRRVSFHYSNICPYVVFQRSHGSNGNGLILQFHMMVIVSPLLHGTEPLIPSLNMRAHPRGECAPASCIFLQCPPLTQRWHRVEWHLSMSL